MLRVMTTLALLLGAVLSASAAQPAVPSEWVTDRANVLSAEAERTLNQELSQYEASTGHQLLIWIDHSTDKIPIEDWAASAFAAWRVGRKGIDDGLILFVFVDDKRTRIEVGYGLEGVIPDALAGRILRETLAPKLQAGDYEGGLHATIDALTAAIGEKTPPNPLISHAQGILMGIFGVLLLILFIFRPSLALWILLRALHMGGGGHGGGGFLGGGGRSGGGGASGRW